MSGPTLDGRLSAIQRVLQDIGQALDRKPTALPADVRNSIREVVAAGADINVWKELLVARETTGEILADLVSNTDGDDMVLFGSTRLPYWIARLLAVQAYLATTWSLADHLVGVAGRIVCIESVAKNPIAPITLVNNFVRDPKTSANLLHSFTRDCFGWHVGISYALRNHFLHDGGKKNGWSFFEGNAAASAFRISSDGWDYLLKHVKENYKVCEDHSREPDEWLRLQNSLQSDLRQLLVLCQRDLDDALGTLLGSACHLLKSQTGFLLGEA